MNRGSWCGSRRRDGKGSDINFEPSPTSLIHCSMCETKRLVMGLSTVEISTLQPHVGMTMHQCPNITMDHARDDPQLLSTLRPFITPTWPGLGQSLQRREQQATTLNMVYKSWRDIYESLIDVFEQQERHVSWHRRLDAAISNLRGQTQYRRVDSAVGEHAQCRAEHTTSRHIRSPLRLLVSSASATHSTLGTNP